jgi:hypothetical protein
LVPGGHALGNGSSQNNANCWDNRVSNANINPDHDDDSCLVVGGRVVQTWHVGNLAWALFRMWRIIIGGYCYHNCLADNFGNCKQIDKEECITCSFEDFPGRLGGVVHT